MIRLLYISRSVCVCASVAFAMNFTAGEKRNDRETGREHWREQLEGRLRGARGGPGELPRGGARDRDRERGK